MLLYLPRLSIKKKEKSRKGKKRKGSQTSINVKATLFGSRIAAIETHLECRPAIKDKGESNWLNRFNSKAITS